MATTKRQEEWFKGAIGRGMNLDRVADYQCVDVPNDYANHLFGDWERTIGRGNAKDKYNIAPSAYWLKIKNDPNSASQIPQRGDVIVWGPMRGNPYGHIAVVESAKQTSVTVIEQNGFESWKPTFRSTHPYLLYGALPIGWLRPRPEKIIGGSMDLGKFVSDFAEAVLDKVEGKPNYRTEQAKAFKGHVDFLYAEYPKRGAAVLEEFLGNIMKWNGVLGRQAMDAHLAKDNQLKEELAKTKLERDNAVKVADSARQAEADAKQAAKVAQDQYEQLVMEVNVQQKQCELHQAESEAQILALQKEITELKNTKPSEAPRSDENEKKVSGAIQIIIDYIKILMKGVKF